MQLQHLLRPALLLTGLMLLGACASTQYMRVDHIPALNGSSSKTAMAGVAITDITPPPGLPKSGYSILAKDGDGFRTRLKARVFYIKDKDGHSTALVQADLQGTSLMLHHKVAELIARKTDVSADRLAILATHTHSSPGNIFASNFYNKHASNGKGLELTYFDFLSTQIADAIIGAYEQQRPAKIATGKKDIFGYNRNRAIRSYLRNPGMENLDRKDPKLVTEAVNPSLYMLRVDGLDKDGNYKPMGAFSTFSIHATTLSAPVTLYNADVFAYMHRDVEWNIQREYKTTWPVAHAMANGTEGDMAPNLPFTGDRLFSHFPVDWKASKKLGQGIAAEAWSLFTSLDDKLSTGVSIQSAAREINIRRENKVDDIEICKDAAAGDTLAAGALERRTPWVSVLPFIKAGSWTSRRWLFFKNGCQGNKRHIGTSLLQPVLEPKDSFPNTVLFQLIRINDLLLIPLPFEVSVEAGKRMELAIRNSYASDSKQAPKHIVISSVANGYFGYSVTPEEYRQQNYEGGHTLYGQYSTPYLAAQLGKLSSDMQASKTTIAELPLRWDYPLARKQHYPEDETATGQRTTLATPTMISAKKSYQEDAIAFEWLDLPPTQMDFHKPLVHVETSTDQGQSWKLLEINKEPISDEGYDISVEMTDDAKYGMYKYKAHWYNPVKGDSAKYRFVVQARGEQDILYSEAF